MKIKTLPYTYSFYGRGILIVLILLFEIACDSDNEETPQVVRNPENPIGMEREEEPMPCETFEAYVFNEKDGLVKVEFEDAAFAPGWSLRPQANASGRGAMVWNGTQYFGTPGNSATSYTLKITNAGTYQFIWRSAVTIGNNGTEHNDTWLRFDDASDFYASRGLQGQPVYPKDRDKLPNPEGASADGWFKVYRSGNDLGLKWQSKTYDNDPHDIYVVFEEAGVYTMEVSVRSSGHAIDSFVLFHTEMSSEEVATDIAMELSEISCGN